MGFMKNTRENFGGRETAVADAKIVCPMMIRILNIKEASGRVNRPRRGSSGQTPNFGGWNLRKSPNPCRRRGPGPAAPIERTGPRAYFFSTGTMISVNSSAAGTVMGSFQYCSMIGPAGR